MAIVWPYDILTPRHMEASFMPGTQRGNTSLEGVSQRVSSDAGLWKVEMEGFTLGTPAQIKLWRALAALVEGGLEQIIMPVEDLDRAPEPRDSVGGILHAGGVPFAGGVGYRVGLYDASVATAAALRATEIVLDHRGFTAPDPGTRLSIGVRYHQLKSVLAEADGQTTYKISPPLRDPVIAKAPVRFDRPRLLCRLSRATDMELKPLDHGRWGTADLTLIEDVGPLA